jgi:hypothetical protein
MNKEDVIDIIKERIILFKNEKNKYIESKKKLIRPTYSKMAYEYYQSIDIRIDELKKLLKKFNNE